LKTRVSGPPVRCFAQVKCTSCGYCSNTYEPFLDLNLELHGKVQTVQEAIARFTAVETLDKANRYCLAFRTLYLVQKFKGEVQRLTFLDHLILRFTTRFAKLNFPLNFLLNFPSVVRWRCSSCEQLVCAKKQLTIYTAPNVCTIQLKRYVSRGKSEPAFPKSSPHASMEAFIWLSWTWGIECLEPGTLI
jgi:hypothetical protein